VIILMENDSDASTACTPTPSVCRTPTAPRKAKLQLKNVSSDQTKNKLAWKWTKGAATPKADFGDPLQTDGYTLCLYEDGTFVQSFSVPAGGVCSDTGRACWRDIGKGFSYIDPELTPDGVQSVKLIEGLVDGKASASLKGKGTRLGLPDLSQLTGVVDVQLQKTTGGPCWGATFSPPHKKNDGTSLKAFSDAATTTTTTTSTTTTTLAPLWSAIHSQVIQPRCSVCHGAQGGLGGLDDCDTGHANLVNVPSTELTTMDRVEPGDPGNSWLMHKLDGTQDWFDPMCESMFCGSQMPLAPPPLSESVRDSIRTWITNGALNDCP
jgi:hypothetical protein